MTPGYEFLSVLRLARIIQALEDRRLLPQELLFVNRTPITPAMDNEIIARNINRVQIADVISDDSRAVTYAAGKLQLETTLIPNIKHGKHLTQEHLNQLAMLNSASARPDTAEMGNNEIYGNFLVSMIDDLRVGVYQRVEQLIIAMHLDSYSYDRLGMKISGSWGIPADLKVTPAVPWTDPVNAKPVDDVWTLKRLASVRYGAMFDRMTMSTQAFLYMIATAEFQAKARTTLPLFINYTNIPQANTEFQKNIATSILGLKELELYDARYWSVDSAGQITSAPYLPTNKVILADSGNDNNAAVQDFANGVTTESTLSGLLPNTGTGVIGGFGAGRRGPVPYASIPPDLNPPQLRLWCVMRGFPRRFRLQASSVLTVGSFVDTAIPVGEPF
jgi:hypothetical protein